jgi:hypothetical protein
MRAKLALIAVALVIAAPAAAEQPMRWLNVHVQEASEGANVQVHLPMQTVLAMMRAIDIEEFDQGRVHLDVDDADIDWQALLAAVREAPDGEFVTATSDDADVVVRKIDGMLTVDVDEKGGDNARVRVRVPAQLLDAFTVDENNMLDIAAMIERLADLPGGDLVQVEADDATVRVWIE